MSFVVTLAFVLAAVVSGVALLLFRRRRWVALVAGAVTLVGALGWFLHPVCKSIPTQNIATFNPPIETRTETGMIGQRYFQRKGDGWVHCKTWIAREFFF